MNHRSASGVSESGGQATNPASVESMVAGNGNPPPAKISTVEVSDSANFDRSGRISAIGLSSSLKDLTREEVSDRLDKVADDYLRGARDQQTRCELIELYKQLKKLDNGDSAAIQARAEPHQNRIPHSVTTRAIEMAHAKFAQLAAINIEAEACRLRLKQSATVDELFVILDGEYNPIQWKWDRAFREYRELAANAVDLINLHVQRIAIRR
jgi:hypothetical protein